MKLILFFALFAIIECRQIGNSYKKSKNLKNDATVEVGVYIESLCPDTKVFILNQLYPTFNKLNQSSPAIMSINLVPFGNANINFVVNSTKNPNITFTCQHKKEECDGNILQSCAVVKYSIEKSLGLINCMFASPNWKTPWTSADECSKKLKLDFDDLRDCAKSVEGLAYEYFMGGQTQSLEPKHNWIPWITIDGKHTDEIQKEATTNLLKLVCDSYKGLKKPTACNSA